MVDIANVAMSQRTWESGAHLDQDAYDKWPVWMRLVTIVGLSALLWAGIISAAIALFN